MNWITYDDVADIVSTALNKGVAAHVISTRYIRDEFGSGGLSTISNHLKRYWAENAAIGVSTTIVASAKLQDLHRIVADIVVEQTAEVRADADARAEKDAVRLAEITDELAYAMKTNGELEIAVGMRDAEIDGLQHSLFDADRKATRLETELYASREAAERECKRLVLERDAARSEALDAKVAFAEASGKLALYERERAEVSEQTADVVAGQRASDAKIERLEGALDELRRERAAALAPTTSDAAPTLITQTPPVETPHPKVQAKSTGEVNG